MRTALGGSDGEPDALRYPKSLFPTAANQMIPGRREPTVIGHWSISPRMPERCDRSVCAREFLIRNAIVRRIVDGWGVVPAYHFPATVVGRLRISEPGNSDTPEDMAAAQQNNEGGMGARCLSMGNSDVMAAPLTKLTGAHAMKSGARLRGASLRSRDPGTNPRAN